MDVDNPGATNYVFQVYDSNYIPLNPKMLTAYYDKQRAISEGKIAKDGTIYRAAQEANAVYREDDNTVYAYYDDHEKKYTATGSGDVREQIVEEDLAPGTTPLPNNNS